MKGSLGSRIGFTTVTEVKQGATLQLGAISAAHSLGLTFVQLNATDRL